MFWGTRPGSPVPTFVGDRGEDPALIVTRLKGFAKLLIHSACYGPLHGSFYARTPPAAVENLKIRDVSSPRGPLSSPDGNLRPRRPISAGPVVPRRPRPNLRRTHISVFSVPPFIGFRGLGQNPEPGVGSPRYGDLPKFFSLTVPTPHSSPVLTPAFLIVRPSKSSGP